MSKVKPLATGIYGIVGAPGAGKSFKAVREIVHSVCTDGRPVYTNVPIRPKKMRAFIYRKLPKSIKGHRARRRRTNLVKPMSQRHFRAFCHRLARIDEASELVLDEMGLDRQELGDLAEFQQTEARNEAMKRVAEKYGPPQITGRDANWIPPGSVLFLDELHKWFPSRNYKDEPKEILDFTSMHRHMQLKVFVMSQRWMNVSLSFRSMAREVWYCMNYAKQPILGFFRLHKWFNVFRYVHYNAENIEERTGLPGIGAKPVWSEMVCPELSGGVEFDLYKSYSHAGTLEQQQAEIRAVTAAMIGEDTEEATDTQQENTAMPKRQTLGKRINKWATIAGVIGIAFIAGRWLSSGGDESEADAEPVAQVETISADTDEQPIEVIEPVEVAPPWTAYRISGVHPNGVIINGTNINQGGTLHDLLLVSVDASAGDSAWLAKDGTSYRGRVGGVLAPGLLPPKIRQQLTELARSIESERQDAAAPSPTPDLDGS